MKAIRIVFSVRGTSSAMKNNMGRYYSGMGRREEEKKNDK